MSQTEPEHSEFADKVSSNSGGWPAKERHRSLKRSDSAKGRRSQGGAVDDASSQQILSAREKKETVALGKNEGENASLISRVTIGAEPDVAFSSTGVDTRCGILWIRPAALQRFCKPRFMLANMCAISFMHSFLTSGSIQRGAAHARAPLPAPQLRERHDHQRVQRGQLHRHSRPSPSWAPAATSRCSSASAFLTVGVGALLFSSVHFIAPAYQWGSEHQDLCPAGELPDEFCLRGDVRNYWFLLMLANAIHGIGSTPFYTLGVSYMDESVPTRTVSTYLGVFSCMGVMGLGFGFMASGFFLRFYVDVTRDVKHLGLTSGSAVWVGAWWIGFLLSGLVMLVISLSSMLFPKHMPSYYSLVEEKNTESHLGEHVMKDASLRQLPGAIYGILSNSTFLSLALAGTADYMMTNAVAQISTKFFESQFAMSSSKAAAFLGAGAVTGGCGGTILGGHLVTRLNMSCENIIKMCLIVSIVPWVCIFMFRSYCPDPSFAVNIPAMLNGSDPFVFPCNKHCNCHNSVYNPVCSVDGTVFFSPCLAGCEARLAKGGARVYANCSCITQYVPEELPNGTFFNVQGRRQKCNTGCTLLPYFTLGLFLALFSNFLNLAPLSAAVLRVVTPKERSLALAVKKIIMRVFASIPGPMLFGHVIDRSCLVWQSIGGHTGSCLYYNNKLLAHNLFYVLILLKTLSVLLYGLSWIKYRENFRSGRRDWHAA
ncbi:hypothetical protein MRX96_055971 [Rhipicephalus microplus]